MKKENKITNILKTAVIAVGVLTIIIACCALLIPKDKQEEIKNNITNLTATKYFNTSEFVLMNGNYISTVTGDYDFTLNTGVEDIVVTAVVDGYERTSTKAVEVADQAGEASSCYLIAFDINNETVDVLMFSNYDGAKVNEGYVYLNIDSSAEIDNFYIKGITVAGEEVLAVDKK
ncbi:MAG: hypothetical protein IJW32_05950 [Clostridia bacterium]|nr:hypothetical protein [Clostridia bacterium]MBQ9793257.1 hypothetical protein [Clostridia bacterium]